MGEGNKRSRVPFSKPVAIILFLLFLWILTGCQSKSTDNFEIHSIPGIGALANSYIIMSDGETALIDPGDSRQIMTFLKERSLSPKYILLTHGHFDHIAGIEDIIKTYPKAVVMVHPADADKLADPSTNASEIFGTKVIVKVSPTPLKDGQVIKLGQASLEVIETPGHTSGSISFRLGNNIFSGDTLMQGSVGRTDFPDGNSDLLTNSLSYFKSLPEDITLLPGHGNPTTIKKELQSNPFLK